MKIDKRWSDEEVKRLISLVRDRPIADVAAELGRGFGSVSGKISELRKAGVKVVTRGPGQPSNAVPFTAEHAEWLKRAVRADKTDAEIAAHFGISVSAVSDRIRKLGLQNQRWIKWSAEEEEKLRAMAGKVSAKAIAATIGRTAWAVRAHANSLGLRVRVRTARQKPQPRPRAARQKEPAPQAAKPLRVPVPRQSRYRYIGTVDYCARCSAPFVNSSEGRIVHQARLAHWPIGRAA